MKNNSAKDDCNHIMCNSSSSVTGLVCNFNTNNCCEFGIQISYQ